VGGLGILVGPGVLGHEHGLAAFATALECGVVNTWGAKGVFRWDSPYHFGTAGLQARDFELAGLGDLDVLVTSGLDPDELTSSPWEGRAEVVDIPPSQLGAARARSLPLPPGTLERPALYRDLAAVVQPMYASDAVPPPAAKLAALVAGALPPGALVVGEPGLVGFWVARTFPTVEAGSVVVPARGGVQAAHRIADAAAQAGRDVLLIAAEAVVLDRVRVDVWSPDRADLDPAPLVAVAGPIVAWGGVPPT
jgi:hypothetical protein